jgi:hypothetical protein
VANKATGSGMIDHPFFFPIGCGLLRRQPNIRPDVSSAPLGFGRIRVTHSVSHGRPAQEMICSNNVQSNSVQLLDEAAKSKPAIRQDSRQRY